MSSYGSIAQMASIVADSVLLQDDATGNGNGTPMDITGYATSVLRIEASVPMAGGTTVYFEISVDGANWVPLMGAQVGTTTTGTSTTSEGEWVFSVAGFQEIRARIGDYGSGTVTVAGYASVLAGAGAGSTGAVTQSGTWAVQVVDSAGTNKASISSGGAVKVDNSAVTQPVSGTFWQATQPVSVASLPLPSGAATSAKQPALGTAGSAATDVITVQGITSMTPLLVNGSSVVQPISASSLPLPTGASTSAKQPSLGTAGTASTDVLTVQGIAAMTPLLTDGSGSTQPISVASLPLPTGAATSAKQPALGTAGTASSDVITVQGIASMTALKTDSSATTQPISAASLPLPTGAATAAKQPALGTAGSASSDVVTVQGVTSMTPLKVDGSGVTLSCTVPNLELGQNSNTSGQVGPLMQAAVLTSAPTYTTDKTSPLTMTTAGALRVDASATTQPVSITGTPTVSETASSLSTGTLQNAVSSTGNGTPFSVAGYGTAIVHVSGTFTATVAFEASVDNSTWTSVLGTKVGTTTTGTSTNAIGDWMLNVAGLSYIRTPVTWTSGTSVTVKAWAAPQSSGGNSGGSSSSVKLLDSAGTNLAAVSASGAVKVEGVVTSSPPAPAATYMATTGIFTPASSATDMAILNGADGKVIKILAIYLNYSASSGTGVNHFHLIKRTSANSSGTGDNEVKVDPSNGSPSAALQHYTSNPSTLGGSTAPNGGTLKIVSLAPLGGGVTPAQTGEQLLWMAPTLSQAITLRAAAQGLAINNNSTSVAGSGVSVGFTFLWTEE